MSALMNEMMDNLPVGFEYSPVNLILEEGGLVSNRISNQDPNNLVDLPG
jgi:hypothetical protein